MRQNAFKYPAITKILPNNTTTKYLPYHPELSSHMFTHTLRCIKQNAYKCHQNIPHAHKSFHACMIPCGTFSPIILNTPKCPQSTLKYHGMQPNALKRFHAFMIPYVTLLPSVSKCSQIFTNVPEYFKYN